jgi:hypothetical protein
VEKNPRLRGFFSFRGLACGNIGLNTDSDRERSLGRRVVEALPDA